MVRRGRERTRRVNRGDRVRILEGDGPPFSGRARGVPAAALISGASLGNGTKPLIDWVEEIDGNPVRKHKWIFDADHLLHFQPDFEAESITVGLFADRFDSDQWCEEHPHHPIAIMRRFFDQLLIMEAKRKDWKPGIVVRNGNCYVYLPPGMSEEDRNIELEKLSQS